MKKILSTMAIATGLTGAAFAGGMAVSSIASAQDEAPPSTEQPAPDESAPEDAPEGCRGPHRGGPGLEAAADAIGISVEDLRAALVDGETLAQVAEANGVDVQVVIDAMVADAQEHLAEKVAAGDLTQEEADVRLAKITERITERVNSNEPPPRGPRGPRGEGAPDVEGSSFPGSPSDDLAA
jgi:hypothetical protein